jgi:NAD(P)-dependent dehydrogenase (short-subunit alcohol dehydrogenase family)
MKEPRPMTETLHPRVQPLQEQSALLIGSTSGIGLEAACQLAEAGVPRIMLNGRREDRAKQAVQTVRQRAPGADVRCTIGDANDHEQSQHVVDATAGAFGGVDTLVSCAGGGWAPKLFHAMTMEEIAWVVHHFFLGGLYCSRAVLPVMTSQNGGAIILVASDAAKVATPGETVVGGVMAGLVMFTKTLAMEAKCRGIRVNCLTPSIVEGTMTSEAVLAGEFSGKVFRKAMARADLGVATPSDQAAMIVYLASPKAARMTGQAISINGGISAG